MAATISVACPECGKQIKAPADLEGKKIRCKDCGTVFALKAPPPVKAGKTEAKPAKKDGKAEAKPAAKPPVKAKAKPKRSVHDDDDDNPNPYGVTDTDLGHRCPYCAQVMEGEDSVICLQCGYNTQTRMRTEMKKVFETTGMDWFLWLLPGILSILTILLLIGFDVLYFFKLPYAEAENEWYWMFAIYGIKLWVIIVTLFIMFFCARFAVKRLIFHPRPPERTRPDSRTFLGVLGLVFGGLLLMFIGIGLFVVVLLIGGGFFIACVAIGAISTGYGMVGGALSYDKR